MTLAEFLCPTKAVMRTWETAHNYANNTNTYTKVGMSDVLDWLAAVIWPTGFELKSFLVWVCG